MADFIKAHILLVDDDPSISRMFQMLLKDAGYRISLVATSEECLQFLKIVIPDVILLDVSLPGMDGVELTQRIKNDPTRPFVPIILITALNDIRTKIIGLDAGADDYLIKPIEFSELLARVRGMIRLQQSRRSLSEATQRIEALFTINQTLNSSLDVTTVLNKVVAQVAKAVGATRASLVLTSNATAPTYASSTNQAYDADGMTRILRDGVAGWVMRSMKPLLLPDAHRDHRWALLGRATESTRSVLSVPIIHDKVAQGAITAVHTRTGYFTAAHVDMLESVAAQSAITFSNAQLFQLTREQKQQLERRSHMLEEMLHVGERLRLNLPLPALLNEIAEAIYRSLGFRHVVIHVQATANSEEAQGMAGSSRNQSAWTAATIVATVLPLLRERFRVSRSYFIPSGYRLDEPIDPHTALLIPSLQVAEHLFVPIGTPTNLSGIIAVDSPTHAGSPDLATVQALEVFANQVATAVQNNRLFSREQERANQLQLLVDVGRSLTELMTQDQLLRLVTSLIRHSFGFYTVAILLVDGAELVLRTAAVSGAGSPPLELRITPQCELAAVINEVRVIRSDDSATFCLDYAWVDQQIVSEMAVPLSTRNGVVGVLIVGSDRRETFEHITESLLTAVAAQLVVALENAQLFAREQAQVQQLSRVNELSIKLTAEQQVELHFTTILADIASIFGASRAALLVFDAADQRSDLVAALPDSPTTASLPLPKVLLAALADDRPQLIVPAVADDSPPSQLVRTLGMDAGVVAQLPASEHVAGLLVLEPPQRGAEWRTSDHNLLQTIANLLAQAMENSQLQQQRMQRLRADMLRYMAPQLVEQLLTEDGGFGAATERDVVVVFADLRGFTALSEGLAPSIVVEQVLNRFFALMTEVLYKHEATIDKFLGDGLMAVFGSVRPRADDVSRALHAAIAMQRAFSDLRSAWNRDLGRDIGLGIGMSWGRAVVGNIGSPQRLDYTLIGDVVNTASRLADIADGGQVVVSQHLVDRLAPAERTQLTELPAVVLKGKVEHLAIYEVRYEIRD